MSNAGAKGFLWSTSVRWTSPIGSPVGGAQTVGAPEAGDPSGGYSAPFLKTYTVFNIDQIGGIDFKPLAEAPVREFKPVESAQQIVEGWVGAPKIEHGRNHAAYSPSRDVIQMPYPGQFVSDEAYYATLFHEMAHATGHESRLNRISSTVRGDPEYSKEELVAEMTAAFLCAKCGIDNSVIEQQAAYLKGWSKALRGNTKLIITASSQAQRAANLIQGIVPEKTEVSPPVHGRVFEPTHTEKELQPIQF